MKDVKIDINRARGQNFLSLSAKLSEDEVDLLTAENRLFLAVDEDGQDCISNVPFAFLGTL